MTPVLQATVQRGAGAIRWQRPAWVDHLPPCNHACPAGENIQGWLYPAESGDYEAAWRLLTADNPFPAIMGRVCYHPCEGACNRGKLDAPVGINSVERFLGDEALARGWAFDPPAAVPEMLYKTYRFFQKRPLSKKRIRWV
jgi:hypothetical protein